MYLLTLHDYEPVRIYFMFNVLFHIHAQIIISPSNIIDIWNGLLFLHIILLYVFDALDSRMFLI